MRACLLLASCLLFLGVGCTAPQYESNYKPSSTIKDLMDALLDPSADVVWEAVTYESTVDGVVERTPQNEEEWEAVRQGAVRLMEAANLLLMPGRRVAGPGEKSENPDVALEPEEIQSKIAEDRDQWVELVHDLHDAAIGALELIDARDSGAMLYAGDRIDRACEKCHLTYWYPNDERARELFEERNR